MRTSTYTRWLAAGVAAVALAGVAGPAAAQSGDSEVRMLRQQMEQLQQRLQKLESKQQETAEEVKKVVEPAVHPDKDVRLELSGRINQGVLFADNGEESDLFVVDNDNSGSRFGLNGEADFGDWTTGTEIVVSLEVNSTDEVAFGQDDAPDTQFGDGDIGDLRQANWYIEHPGFGFLSIGQGDEAGQDASETDLSGTTLVAQSDVDDTAGSLQFHSETPGFERIEEVDDFFVNLDGGRTSRVLYETPQFGGFSLRGSLSDGDGLEPAAAINYGAEIGGYEVEAAAAWRKDNDDEDASTIHGSASILAPFGINVTFAGGTQDPDESDADDPNFFYGKLGYRADFFEFGDTRFSIDYFLGHNNADFASPDGDLPKATSFGGGVVQKISPLSTELYLGVRSYEVEDLYDGANKIEDPDTLVTVLSGARVRF
jgi:hypothetical protein